MQPAFAQEAAPSTAQTTVKAVDTETVDDLKAHIRLLEERLARLEQRLTSNEQAVAEVKAENATAMASSDEGQAGDVLPMDVAGTVPVAQMPAPPPPPDTTETNSYEIVRPADALAAAQSNAEREDRLRREAMARNEEGQSQTDELDDTTLAATLLFRNTAPTLKANKWEISEQVDYARTRRDVQNERSVMSTTTLRYGIKDGLEVALAVPFYWANRETRISESQIYSDPTTDIGDIQVRLSSELWKPKDLTPGASMSFAVTAPTSTITPYYEGAFNTLVPPGKDVRDPLVAYLATQNWAVSSNIQFYNTFSPIVVFGGVGFQYFFERDVGPNTVQPGTQFNFNAGLSLALSEYTTLGFQAATVVQDRMWVNGAQVSREDIQEQSQIRVTAVQRINQGEFLEPAVTMGLTDETPDVVYSLAWRKQF